MKTLFLIPLLGTMVLAGCGGRAALPPPEPVVIAKTVNVPTPVPCPALAQLGTDPAFPDTLPALRAAAGNLADVVTLLLVGRRLREQRLAEYGAVREGCSF